MGEWQAFKLDREVTETVTAGDLKLQITSDPAGRPRSVLGWVAGAPLFGGQPMAGETLERIALLIIELRSSWGRGSSRADAFHPQIVCVLHGYVEKAMKHPEHSWENICPFCFHQQRRDELAAEEKAKKELAAATRDAENPNTEPVVTTDPTEEPDTTPSEDPARLNNPDVPF